jgi:hypothetical protein
MAETIHNSNRRYGECLGSVGISTLVDRSTRHLLQTQPTKKKLAVLNRLFIFVSPTLQRPHKSISEKVKPFGWLAQSLRLHIEAADHRRGILCPSRFLQSFPILQYVLPCFQTLHASDGPWLYLRRPQKSNFIITS